MGRTRRGVTAGAGVAGLAVLVLTLAGAPGLVAQEGGDGGAYEKAGYGTRWLDPAEPGGPRIKVLVEPSNLGGEEVALAEIEFGPGSAEVRRAHRHPVVEIFYVLSGVLEHVVDGEVHRLTPGMVGIVRPGDDVIHRVWSHEPVRALVVWAPGTEAERLAEFFRTRPVEGSAGGGG